MSVDNIVVHLVAGGFAGTLGSVITCPLDVAKTRLQSSLTSTYRPTLKSNTVGHARSRHLHNARLLSSVPHSLPKQDSVGFYRCIKYIVKTEGPKALFKGLGPTLVGVAPSRPSWKKVKSISVVSFSTIPVQVILYSGLPASRAIYFCTYAYCKQTLSRSIAPSNRTEHSFVHLCSAATAGFASTTSSNPIWVVKTRLQLDNKKGKSMTAGECIRRIYSQDGLRGFYKGLTASYFGITETVIHFVIYEAIKSKLTEMRLKHDVDRDKNRKVTDFAGFMAAAATSKTIATCIAYPHEVARTRMREEGTRYTKFWETLKIVAREEGTRSLYRGLTTQLIKHIPNTAIVMSTYEAVVYLCYKYGF